MGRGGETHALEPCLSQNHKGRSQLLDDDRPMWRIKVGDKPDGIRCLEVHSRIGHGSLRAQLICLGMVDLPLGQSHATWR